MMGNKVLKIALISMMALMLTNSCNAQFPVNTKTNSENVNFDSNKSVYLIAGIALFPNPSNSLYQRESQKEVPSPSPFSTKADITTVAPNATVSVIYPANHATTPNKTIATGLTDTYGNFIINPSASFVPSTNEIFILEAAKRIGSIGNYLITIRTYIKWNGTSWNSITTPNIFINDKTTALTIIDENNAAIVPLDTIGKIAVSGGSSTPSAVGTVTVQTILDVAGLVNTVLSDNLDPFFSVGYESSTDSFFINQNNNVGKFADVGNCTGTNCDVTDLSGVNLAGQYLAGLELSGKNFSGAELYGANLSYSSLINTNLVNANLMTANLVGVNLNGASLMGADLSFADLSTSDLSNANLTTADLTGANLTGVDLTTANITGTDLSYAIWTDGVKICAQGSIGQCN